MRIAIDLSPLQNAHRMRGIGYTLLNFINNLPESERSQHHFIFYVLPDNEALFKNPFELVNIKGIDYEIRQLKPIQRIQKTPPSIFGLPIRIVNRFLRMRDAHFGFSRTINLHGVDVLLQADQNQLLPRWGVKVKKVLIVYDLIPFVLEADYLWTYNTARLRGCSRKGAIRHHLLRKLYVRKMRLNTKRADKLIAISERTKNDFVSLLSVPPKKISVILLGVSDIKNDIVKPHNLQKYIKTGWGYLHNPLIIHPEIPFLLYIGGADSRRKLEDLVAAFNNLRARGRKLKLILAGDIMLGPKAITNSIIRKSLEQSSYIEDIIFMGFVDDQTRDWLYANAAVFVFPSKYEGFGLPVLEAMAYGCPVISYRNQAIEEVAGNTPKYVENLEEMARAIDNLLSYEASQLTDLGKKSISQAKKFSWTKTSREILFVINNMKP